MSKMAAGNAQCCESLRTALANLEASQSRLVADLECPVCRETCCPPIFMCPNSHIVCSTCQKKILDCPICRAPGQPDRKNLFAEATSKELGGPCENATWGCKTYVMHHKISEHRNNCKLMYECDENDCEFVGNPPLFHRHYVAAHPESCTVGAEWAGYIKSNQVLCKTRYFSVEEDFLKCGFYPDAYGMRLYAESYGSVEVAAKYDCVFEFGSMDNTFKCSYRIPFQVIYQGSCFGNANFVATPIINLLKQGEGGEFRCKIKIWESKKVEF